MDYPDRGKCRSCGFLSKHARQASGLPSPRFYEVEHAERLSSDAFQHHTVGYGMRADTEPMCFMQKINLMETLQFQGSAKFLEAINADRHCDSWYPYMPGLSPMEHYQEVNMRAFEKSLEDERSMRERSYRRQDRYFVIASLILAAAQIIAAVILSYRETRVDELLRKVLGFY